MDAACTRDYTRKDTRNYRTFSLWLIAAGVAFAATTIVLSEGYVGRGVVGWALAAVTIALFAITGRTYVIFLRGADELVRKVHLEALAASFGATALFMLGWRLCERLGAPKLDVDDPFLVMIVVWLTSVVVGFRRYAGSEE